MQNTFMTIISKKMHKKKVLKDKEFNTMSTQ
jgi:hypothetical protein